MPYSIRVATAFGYPGHQAVNTKQEGSAPEGICTGRWPVAERGLANGKGRGSPWAAASCKASTPVLDLIEVHQDEAGLKSPV